MTKYELKEKKRLEKRLKKEQKREIRKVKRKERKLARRTKREQRRFERKSEAAYRWYHRIGIKVLRIGGFFAGFAYVIHKLYGTFTLETDELVGKLNLDHAILLLFFGTVAFGFFLYFGFKYLKTAIAANAVAANLGKPSLKYSPVVITFIRGVLSMWFFGILWLFQYIGMNYGEAMSNGMDHMAAAFAIVFGTSLLANILEQSILARVRRKEHEAQDESRLMVKAVYDNIQSQKPVE